MIRRSFLALAISVIATSANPGFAAQPIVPFATGALYTMSNEANGNSILVFDRFPNGHLQPALRVFAGGNGSGSRLGSQGGLTLTANQRWLLAVNAGSDTVSVLEVGVHSLRLVDTAKTGHVPLSITTHGDLVYVLNGGSESIQGFRLDRSGQLTPIKGSVRKLTNVPGTQPAQIGFSPEGEFLVVTEKAASKILTLPLRADGTTDDPLVQDSNGVTPFGFAFGKRDQLLVSESFGDAPRAGATSSYELGADGLLTTISASTRDKQSASCCTAITPNGEFAYVTNTGSGTISGYRIDFSGSLSVLDAAGVSAVTGGKPIDLALTGGGQFLYSLVSETNEIAAYHVQLDGSLRPVPFNTVPLPASADGLAVR
jgi:6-phosphogluconolactonase (cycloisomerase 2 family)